MFSDQEIFGLHLLFAYIIWYEDCTVLMLVHVLYKFRLNVRELIDMSVTRVT